MAGLGPAHPVLDKHSNVWYMQIIKKKKKKD